VADLKEANPFRFFRILAIVMLSLAAGAVVGYFYQQYVERVNIEAGKKAQVNEVIDYVPASRLMSGLWQEKQSSKYIQEQNEHAEVVPCQHEVRGKLGEIRCPGTSSYPYPHTLTYTVR